MHSYLLSIFFIFSLAFSNGYFVSVASAVTLVAAPMLALIVAGNE